MWKTVAASVQGTSHIKNQTVCQDYSVYRQITFNGELITLAAISDGAGSASLSHEGAKFVVNNWLDLTEHPINKSVQVNPDKLIEIADQVKNNLLEEVNSREGVIDDYACTLLTAVLFPDKIIVFQVGDGAWVYRNESGYGCATWPYQGEYAGETVFLTSSHSSHHYQTAQIEKVNAVAGFTDGLERLVLKMATKEASPAFFEGLFRSLALNSVDDTETNLQLFLNSDRFNDRTDDDKTLILAIKI